MKKHLGLLLIFSLWLILCTALWAQQQTRPQEPITPLPQSIKLDKAKVDLGRMLFHDKRFSKDNTVSCASCHIISKGGVDNRAKSLGVKNRIGEVNAPTVYNADYNIAQFWDGRANALEDQVDGPTHKPIEMDSSWPEIVGKLKKDPKYVRLFKEIYNEPINPTNIKNAIATYERSLITPNSRFDRYLLGDKNALTPDELKGYQLFKSYGCIACHQGINIGGNMFQTFGVFGNYFEDRGNVTQADYGRYNVTGRKQDRFVFKVPSLRNVAITAPYFHDGSAKTLTDAVNIMAKYQLGRTLPKKDVELIVKFLQTLTGKHKELKP